MTAALAWRKTAHVVENFYKIGHVIWLLDGTDGPAGWERAPEEDLEVDE